MARSRQLPTGVRPKTRAVDNAKLIMQATPVFKQYARNLLKYGASKRDLYRLIDEA